MSVRSIGNPVSFEILQGKEQIEPHLDTLAQLNLEIYPSYPYLIGNSSLEEERECLVKQLSGKTSLVVLAKIFDKEEEKAIGAITGAGLSEQEEHIIEPFTNARIPIKNIFYASNIVLQESYQNKHIGSQMMEKFKEQMQLLYPAFTRITFCAVERPENDPRKPENYHSLDAYWAKNGCVRYPELFCDFEWEDIGDTGGDTPKKMVFWLADIVPPSKI